MKTYKKKIKELENVKNCQCSNGNWNYSPYMLGMANGLILALSILNETNPEYLDAPEVFLENVEIDEMLKPLKVVKPTEEKG